MNFDFDEYFMNLFTIPIILIIFGCIIVIGFLVELFFINRFKNKKRVLTSILIVIFFGALVLSGLGDLEFSIIHDRNSESVLLVGEIGNVEYVSSPPRFHYEGEIVNPVIITVDGGEYYLMSIGYYDEGDEVVIEYLPNSKVVVSIRYVD